MFSKKFPLFVVSVLWLLLFVFAVAAFAQATPSAEAVPTFDIKTLPAWLQWLLGGFGIGGVTFWTLMKYKLVKFIHLFEDCKLFITATMNMVTQVKKIVETAAPSVKQVWYEWLYAAGHLLIETGNKSLAQKGKILISHVPEGVVISRAE